MKLNGYEYTHDEVVEAVKKKGYIVIPEESEPDKRGNIRTDWYAIRDGKTLSLQSAAIKEFHKKPPLV